MARGSKKAYTSKQKRKASKIAKGAMKSGQSTEDAERIAWATVNKEDHGGKKSGSGRGKKSNKSASRKGGKHSHSGREAAPTTRKKTAKKTSKKTAKKSAKKTVRKAGKKAS